MELPLVSTHKGVDKFEEMAMLALVHLGPNAYGVTIRKEIRERTRRDLSYATIYKVLDRLEQKGFVSSFRGESTPERGGRAKRYFRIEAPGERALVDERNAMEQMWADVPMASEA